MSRYLCIMLSFLLCLLYLLYFSVSVLVPCGKVSWVLSAIEYECTLIPPIVSCSRLEMLWLNTAVFYRTRVYQIQYSSPKPISTYCLSITPVVSKSTFPSWVPNSTQITEELQAISFNVALRETKTRIYTSLKFDFYFRFCWLLCCLIYTLYGLLWWSVERRGG